MTTEIDIASFFLKGGLPRNDEENMMESLREVKSL
jgi:hypothetical protein